MSEQHTSGRVCDACEGFCLVSAEEHEEQHAKRYAWLRHHWLEIVAVRESGGSLRLVAHDEAGIGDEDDAAHLDRAIDAAIAKATGSTHV